MSKVATAALTALALTIATTTASLAASKHHAQPHSYSYATHVAVPSAAVSDPTMAAPFVWSSTEEARFDPARGFISGE